MKRAVMDEILKINQTTYDALAPEYEEKSVIREDFNAKVIDRFVPFIKTGKEVLDVGCAVGLDIALFSAKGFFPTGVELSPEMVLRARKRNPGIKIIEGDFSSVSLDKKYDAIYAQSFIHLFPKEKAIRIFKKMKDFLKVGGIAHVTSSKSSISGEGFVEKSDYAGNFKRFRKIRKKKELEASILGAGFNVANYYEIIDPYEKEWMVFTIEKPNEVK